MGVELQVTELKVVLRRLLEALNNDPDPSTDASVLEARSNAQTVLDRIDRGKDT